jgi:16S rRNA (cytosine967-C5)-methyltransferase
VAASHAQLVTLDGEQALPFSRAFDRILVDAPCSGTGTLARNPEIRWRLEPDDLSDLHARQVRLLSNALDRLTPRGRLVYSTCSLEPEENEDVVRKVLRSRPEFEVASASKALNEHLRSGPQSTARGEEGERNKETLFDQEGAFRTLPPAHGTDGFYAVAIEKKG